jgi:hypothetical protein
MSESCTFGEAFVIISSRKMGGKQGTSCATNSLRGTVKLGTLSTKQWVAKLTEDQGRLLTYGEYYCVIFNDNIEGPRAAVV